jgi:hypothetical protein
MPLDLPTGVVSSGFPSKTFCALPLSPGCATCHARFISLLSLYLKNESGLMRSLCCLYL